jgi:hypothetical protein
MAYLIFIDTNIFLDFYRVVGREGSLSILDHVDANHHRIITTAQVEMEFKKNRQRVILDAFRGLKLPDFSGMKLPAFFAASKQSGALGRSQKTVKRLHSTLSTRIGRVLKNPTRYDPVYKTAQRLFRADTPVNLGRDKKLKYTIRRLARQRFALGYPPRKDGDTQIGDAVNWEWVVHCAQQTGDHVVVVSRDSDYGASFEKTLMMNDWLAQEFRERVSHRRKLVLTDRLSVALRQASIPVSAAEEKTEEQFLSVRPPALSSSEAGGLTGRDALQALMTAISAAQAREQVILKGLSIPGFLKPTEAGGDDDAA